MTASGLRRSWVTCETYRPRSRSRSRSPCARYSSEPATRPISLRPLASATSRSPSPMRWAAAAIVSSCFRWRLPARSNRRTRDEHEHDSDRHQPLGLDQQQVALHVLRRQAHGEQPPRPDATLGERAEIAGSAGARSGEEVGVPSGAPAVDPGEARAVDLRRLVRAPTPGTPRPASARGSRVPRARRGRGSARPPAGRRPQAQARRPPRRRSRGGLRAAGA